MRQIIQPSHPCFSGHFPGFPILPGVLVLERVLAAAESQLGHPIIEHQFLNVKFLSPVLPSNEINVNMTSTGADHKFTVQVYLDQQDLLGQVACSGMLRLKP
jgi:3-hydroxyacyl-[acyl-carrier-protein] dehydratase